MKELLIKLFGNWEARDWVALITAAGLVSWGLVLIFGIATRGGSISEKGGEIFVAIAVGLVNGLGLYWGRNNRNGAAGHTNGK